MRPIQSTQWIACSECEEFRPQADLRWFALDGLYSRDQDGRTEKLQYETVAADPDGRPYCARCARQFDHLRH